MRLQFPESKINKIFAEKSFNLFFCDFLKNIKSKYTVRQCLNCRRGRVPQSRFRCPPLRERWINRGKRPTKSGRIRVTRKKVVSTKLRGKSDSEGETLQQSAKTFFFGLHLILAKKLVDSRRRPFSFLVLI